MTVQTGSDRTLFFDFYPPPPARLLGSSMHRPDHTAAGAVQNEATRRALLVGADGIMFIADSRRGRERDNISALEELRNCLFDLNVSPDQLAFVMAWNKRDLVDALSVGELEAGLNLNQAPQLRDDCRGWAGRVRGLPGANQPRTRLGTQTPTGDDARQPASRVQLDERRSHQPPRAGHARRAARHGQPAAPLPARKPAWLPGR